VVDDNPFDLELSRQNLEKYYNVISAKSGEEATQQAKAHQPDLILLDISMPGMDGFQTLEQLKKSATTKHIPVIFHTGVIPKESEEKAFELGVSDIVTKDSSRSLLVSRIRSMLTLTKSILIKSAVHDHKLLADIELRLRKKAGAILLDSEEVDELIGEISIFQAEILAQNEELQEQQKITQDLLIRLSDLENDLPVGYLRLDNKTFQILEINRIATDLLEIRPGISSSLALDVRLTMHFSVDGKNILLADWINSPDQLFPLDLESKKTKNWVTLAKSHLEDGSILIAVVDITRRKKAEKFALESNRVKTDFIQNVSHELRTPMTHIMGFVQMLKHTELTQKQNGYVENTLKSAHILMELIVDMLDFSEIEKGGFKAKPRRINFIDLIHSFHDEFNRHSELCGVGFSLDISDSVPEMLTIDPDFLKKILGKVIGNAFKFSVNDGSVCLNVNCKNTAENHHRLELVVTDNGIGIELEKMDSLFELFRQGDSSTTRKYGGTGLGLPLTKEMVSALNGWIRIESKPGVGTSVFIELPCDA